MSQKYPVYTAAKDEAARTKIKAWADEFSMAHLPKPFAYFASACDCNIKILSAQLAYEGEDLTRVFKVAPLIGPSVVRDTVTVSAALVRESVERTATLEASWRVPANISVGRTKKWHGTSTSANHPFAVDDAIDCQIDWLTYADDKERITCYQFGASSGLATLYVPRVPELRLRKALLYRVNTDALEYPNSPAYGLKTADEIKAHFKALAAKASREVKAYNARAPSAKKRTGQLDAFAQQRAAMSRGQEPPLLRNPKTLIQGGVSRLVREGGLTAVVLAITAELEPPFPWSLPEWKSTRNSDVRRRRADAVPGTRSRRWRGPP